MIGVLGAKVVGKGQTVVQLTEGEWIVTYTTNSKQSSDDARQLVARAYGLNSVSSVWVQDGIMEATPLTESKDDTRVFYVRLRHLTTEGAPSL